MIKLPLERKGTVVFMTVPPLANQPELEDAVTIADVASVELWDQVSDTETTVVQLPLLVWKRFLHLMQKRYETRLIFQAARAVGFKIQGPEQFQAFREKAQIPEEKALVFVLNGLEYRSARDLPEGEALTVELGEFVLTQPKLRVTDPGYDKDCGCPFTIEALPGKWRAQVTLEDDGSRGFSVSRLTVVHESGPEQLDYAKFEATPIGNAGVDSGQCGFFDEAKYPTDKAQLEYAEDTFYHNVCTLLSSKYEEGASEYMAAVISDFGAASQTFYGDGGYNCRVLRNNDGQVIAAYLWYAPKADPFFPDNDSDKAESGA